MKISVLIENGADEITLGDINILLTDKGRNVCEEEKRKKPEWITGLIRKMGEDDVSQMFLLINRMFDIIEDKEN